MKWLKIMILGAGLPFACLSSAFPGEISQGAAPGLLNYQGRLERDNAPITGPIHLVFRIYNASSGGTAVYTSPEMTVSAVQGLFSASLTPPWSVFSGAGTLYLEVQVESDVMSPREPLASVAYSLIAKKLEDGADLAVATLTTTGNMGVGTSPDNSFSLTVASTVWIRSGVLRFPDNTVMTSANVASVAGTLTSPANASMIADDDSSGTGDMVFQNGATTNARITNAGNMGVGPVASAAPMGRLDVDGSLYIGAQGVYDRTGGSVTVSGLSVQGGGIAGANSESILLGRTDNVIAFWSGATERMRIHSNGNIGIGLANPADSLHAAGGIASDTGMRGGRVALGGYSAWGSGANEIRSEAGYDLLVQQSNSYNVGIGTDTPREKLHVKGSVRADSGVIAATAAFSGAVNVGGSFAVATGGGNTASLPTTTIYGDLLVTGTMGSGPSLPALLAGTQTFTAPNIFSAQVTVSTNLIVSNRIGAGVLDFDFAPARYLQIGDDKPEFAGDDAAAYIVGGTNGNSRIFFYRGAAQAGRIETGGTTGSPALATVVGSTKSYIDNTYYRIYNSVLIISTGDSQISATTPAIFVSSSLGNVGMGTAVMDPNHRLTVDGNIRISAGSLIFSDGTAINSASGGLSVGGVSNNGDAVVRSDADINGVGNIILQAGNVNALVVNTGGLVGIGTSSPASRLNVRGGDLVVGSPVIGSYSGNGLDDVIISGNLVVDQSIIQRSATPVQFSAMNISGNVFLSTAAGALTRIGSDTPPVYDLDVTGDINASGALRTGATERISAGGVLSNTTWNGTTIGVPYGGTGATTLSGVLKGNAAAAVTAMTGTLNRVARWTPDGSTLGDSMISDNGTTVSFTGALVVTGTGSFSGDVSMNGTGKITNLAAPTVAADAATRGYVDAQTGSGAGAWGLGGNNNFLFPSRFLGTADLSALIIKTNDTERMRIASGGTISVAAFTSAGLVKNDASGNLSGGNSVALGTEVSGTLPVANGGTGATTLTGVLRGNGTGAFTAGTVNLGSSDVTGTLSGGNGGTNNVWMEFYGPEAAGGVKTYTLPNITTTILTTSAAVSIAYGGTGATTKTTAFDALSPMTAAGDIIYGLGASGTGTRLAGSAGFLKSPGAGAPSWAAISLPSSDVTGILVSTNGGTGNGYTKFFGPVFPEKTFTLPNISATILTTSAPVSVSYGGTNASTAAGARTNLGAAASGANSDITSLSALSTALSVGQGGTGLTTLASGNVLVGNGTGAVDSVNGLSATFQVVGSTVTSTCYNLTFSSGVLTSRATVACN